MLISQQQNVYFRHPVGKFRTKCSRSAVHCITVSTEHVTALRAITQYKTSYCAG